jgi:hypothetical protein
MQTGHNTFTIQQQHQQQQQPHATAHSQLDSLDDFGFTIRGCLKPHYQIVGVSSGPFGEGYRGFAQGSNGHREVFVGAKRHDETDEGWNARRDELMQIHQGLVSTQHPAILPPRDIFEIQECNTTAFVFDAPDYNLVTLRQFLRGLQQDPPEDVVGALFTPIVAGLQFLEQQSLLPNFARVNIDSCFVYPDGTIRMLHPAVTVNGEKGPKKLEKRLKKVEKKAEKGDQEAAEEREDLFERFIIADLSRVLYEMMTRKLSQPSRHKMEHDAKKMQKTEQAQFSPELTQLLVDMLEAGRSPKKELITLDQILQRPVMQRFIDMLVANAQNTQQMSEFQKAVYLRMFQRQQLQGGSIAARGEWLASGEEPESAKHRRQMVRGEGQQLSPLQDQPVEKRNETRFDIPLEGERRRFMPKGRRQSQPFVLQQQQQFDRPVEQVPQGEQPIVRQSEPQPQQHSIDSVKQHDAVVMPATPHYKSEEERLQVLQAQRDEALRYLAEQRAHVDRMRNRLRELEEEEQEYNAQREHEHLEQLRRRLRELEEEDARSALQDKRDEQRLQESPLIGVANLAQDREPFGQPEAVSPIEPGQLAVATGGFEGGPSDVQPFAARELFRQDAPQAVGETKFGDQSPTQPWVRGVLMPEGEQQPQQTHAGVTAELQPHHQAGLLAMPAGGFEGGPQQQQQDTDVQPIAEQELFRQPSPPQVVKEVGETMPAEASPTNPWVRGVLMPEGDQQPAAGENTTELQPHQQPGLLSMPAGGFEGGPQLRDNVEVNREISESSVRPGDTAVQPIAQPEDKQQFFSFQEEEEASPSHPWVRGVLMPEGEQPQQPIAAEPQPHQQPGLLAMPTGGCEGGPQLLDRDEVKRALNESSGPQQETDVQPTAHEEMLQQPLLQPTAEQQAFQLELPQAIGGFNFGLNLQQAPGPIEAGVFAAPTGGFEGGQQQQQQQDTDAQPVAARELLRQEAPQASVASDSGLNQASSSQQEESGTFGPGMLTLVTELLRGGRKRDTDVQPVAEHELLPQQEQLPQQAPQVIVVYQQPPVVSEQQPQPESRPFLGENADLNREINESRGEGDIEAFQQPIAQDEQVSSEDKQFFSFQEEEVASPSHPWVRGVLMPEGEQPLQEAAPLSSAGNAAAPVAAEPQPHQQPGLLAVPTGGFEGGPQLRDRIDLTREFNGSSGQQQDADVQPTAQMKEVFRELVQSPRPLETTSIQTRDSIGLQQPQPIQVRSRSFLGEGVVDLEREPIIESSGEGDIPLFQQPIEEQQLPQEKQAQTTSEPNSLPQPWLRQVPVPESEKAKYRVQQQQPPTAEAVGFGQLRPEHLPTLVAPPALGQAGVDAHPVTGVPVKQSDLNLEEQEKRRQDIVG